VLTSEYEPDYISFGSYVFWKVLWVQNDVFPAYVAKLCWWSPVSAGDIHKPSECLVELWVIILMRKIFPISASNLQKSLLRSFADDTKSLYEKCINRIIPK